MTKLNQAQEREDFLAESIDVGMKFQVIEKTALKKKELKNGGIEVLGVNHFKFCKDDIIVIDDVLERTVKFHVLRDGEDKTKKDKVIEFEFNKIIFVQRFDPFTDIDNVIENISGLVNGVI